MKECKILSMDKAVIRKNSIRTEHLCNQLLSKPGTKLRLEAIQNVTWYIELRRWPHEFLRSTGDNQMRKRMTTSRI